MGYNIISFRLSMCARWLERVTSAIFVFAFGCVAGSFYPLIAAKFSGCALFLLCRDLSICTHYFT